MTDTTLDAIQSWLVTQLARRLGVAAAEVDVRRRFDDYGLDSLEAVGVTGEIETHFACRVAPTALWDFPTIAELAAHLVAVLGRERATELGAAAPASAARAREAAPAYTQQTYDMFLFSQSPDHAAARRFHEWIDAVRADSAYGFEAARLTRQESEVEAIRTNGERLTMLNMSSYNYLGYGNHPAVIAAAKDALDRYGLGAASSPVISGTNALHTELERGLVAFLGLPGRGASLFSSGYAVNTGTISAFVHQGHHVVLDRSAHASLLEGAQLSRATISYFAHNDPADLDRVLTAIAEEGRRTRVLVATEGVFSADGDFGKLADIAAVCRKHDARLLVDEAHSILVAGPNGRGVAEAQGVLDAIDLLVVTFSKGFGGVGGALIAREEITQYVNWYAKCRMFSCALDPAVTGGILQGLALASSADGAARRKRICENADYFRARLRERVTIGDSESWIVPVHYGSERLTIPLNDYLQRRGLDTSIMQFPAVPKGESRIRLFVTSEHSRAQLDRAADILFDAAERFGFSTR